MTNNNNTGYNVSSDHRILRKQYKILAKMLEVMEYFESNGKLEEAYDMLKAIIKLENQLGISLNPPTQTR